VRKAGAWRAAEHEEFIHADNIRLCAFAGASFSNTFKVGRLGMDTRHRSYIFISYCRADSQFAQRLLRSLEKAGLDIWIDARELKAGDSLLDRIHFAINSANFFLVLLSSHSVNSKWVQQELKFAFTRQLKNNERFVIPLLIDNCAIPTFLEDRVYVDFSNKRKFNAGIARLLKAIDENIIGASQSPKPVSSDRDTRQV